MMNKKIRYLYNTEMGMELIFCGNSTISYPLHNHISTLTIGMIFNLGNVYLRIKDKQVCYITQLSHKVLGRKIP